MFSTAENQTMRILWSSIEKDDRRTPTFPTLGLQQHTTSPALLHSISPRLSPARKVSSENETRRGRRSNGLLLADDPSEPLQLPSSSRVIGPYFESNRTSITVSARAGQTVMFDCAVVLLQGRTVRKK